MEQAYSQALKKTQQARRAKKRYIGIQHLRQGGYRLIATNNPPNEHCYDFGALPRPFYNDLPAIPDFTVKNWAENILYRLHYLHYLDHDPTDFLDSLE